MKKIITSVLIAATLCLALCPLISCGGATVDGVIPRDAGTHYVVVGCDKSYTDIVVPSEYNGKPVTEVATGAFVNCNNLITLVLPDSVESIAKGAIENNHNLNSLTLGSGLKNLSPEAAYNNNCLVEIINKSELEIYNHTGDYTALARSALIIHDGPTKLERRGEFIFITREYDDEASTTLVGYTGSHRTLYLPDEFTYSIGNNVFWEETDIVELFLPDCITYISAHSFSGCSNLTEVYYNGTAEGWDFIKPVDENSNYELYNAYVHFGW
jgi:hypothetical protein